MPIKSRFCDGYKENSVNELIYDLEKEKNLEKNFFNFKKKIPRKELEGNGQELYELGRKAYFDEYFYGIKSELINKDSFKLGYESAERIVKLNIKEAIPEEYLQKKEANKKR